MKAAKEACRFCWVWGMGCYPSLLLVANPIWWCAATEKKTCLLQVFGSVGEKRSYVRVGFNHRRVWLCSYTTQLVRAFLRALPGALSCSGLGFSIHSTFCARAWAVHPAGSPWSCWGGSCGNTRSVRGSWSWAENLNAVEKEISCCPLVWKICPLGSILSLPISARAWSLIWTSLAFSELLLNSY